VNQAALTVHELIDEGQPLVYSLASRIHRTVPVRVDLNDLIAYGEVGLAEAARDFDSGKGAQFTTFAYYRIRGEIYDGLSKMTWMSRSRYRRLKFQQHANDILNKEAGKTGGENSSVATEADWLGNVSEKLAVVFLSSSNGDLSEESIEDGEASAPTVVAQKEEDANLHRVVSELPDQQRRLIELIYFEGSTLQEAGNRLGFSKSWASRLHTKALEGLGIALRK